MAFTIAVMFGSGAPAAASPPGGVAMMRVTSAWIALWNDATLLVSTGWTAAATSPLAISWEAVRAVLATSSYARR